MKIPTPIAGAGEFTVGGSDSGEDGAEPGMARRNRDIARNASDNIAFPGEDLHLALFSPGIKVLPGMPGTLRLKPLPGAYISLPAFLFRPTRVREARSPEKRFVYSWPDMAHI